VGNEMRSDDALGILVARELHRRLPTAVRVVESNGEGGGMIESWSGADRALIVDAVSAPGPAGSVIRFDASTTHLPHSFLLASSHSFGVGEAIEVARAIGRLPSTVILYGIVGESFEMGTGLSDPVVRNIPELLQMISEEVVSHA
jgi:hydrogenase maturation protease